MNVLAFLQIATEVGLDGAVLLSVLSLQEGGVFEGHSRELEKITGLKYNRLLKTRHHLKAMELIEEKRVGIPPRLRIVLTEKGKELINNGRSHERKA